MTRRPPLVAGLNGGAGPSAVLVVIRCSHGSVSALDPDPGPAFWAASPSMGAARLVMPQAAAGLAVGPRAYPVSMPRLASFYGIVIYMYWADHSPPHFHAEYGGDQAVLVIADGSVVAGDLPRRALRLVEEWRQLHVEELIAAWDLASNRENPGTIDPLP